MARRAATQAAGTGTVERALLVLRCIAECGEKFSTNEAAERLGLPKSTTHRLLSQFTHAAMLEHSEGRQDFQVGPELFRIATLITKKANVAALAEPFLRDVRDASNETCALWTFSPATQAVTCVAVAQTGHALRYNFEESRPASILAWGSVGPVILAYLPEPATRRIIAAAGKSPASGRQRPPVNEIMAGLAQIRRRGYAYSKGEVLPQAVGFGAPVFDAEGAIVGCMAITVPKSRYRPADQHRFITLLCKQAAALSRTLGYDEPAAR